jgi:hypothetical protein
MILHGLEVNKPGWTHCTMRPQRRRRREDYPWCVFTGSTTPILGRPTAPRR